MREEISARRSFNKHGPSCLHVAICEAGVQASFDFVSHIQTDWGGGDYICSPSAAEASRWARGLI